MGKRTPIGEFPSIKAAVEALIAQGMTRKAIMDELNITALQYSSARAFTTHFTMSNKLTDALVPYAKARHMPVGALIRYIVETVIDNDIVDSVLDDDNDDILTIKSKKYRNEYIKKHYKNGMSAKKLARKFNITAQHVYAIYHGRKQKL